MSHNESTVGADDFQRIRDLFETLVDMPPDARAAALDAVPLDAGMRQRLLDLLARDAALAHTTARPALAQSRLDAAPRGARIGPFTIERELGRGGMGSVYLAQRAVPGGTQRVALKCLYPLGAAGEFERRFHAEIGVLAQLSHPHIGRLIDAGQESDGRCWIAMEFIEGAPLLEYCDAHHLTVPARLALFETLCDAVSAAHRNLVVHRDIKSGNVLVRDDGQLFLIDFGIARTLRAGGDVTQLEQRFLSPFNAAPEQILGEPTTTACDVYGLGVLLYELLCGVAPIEHTSRSSEAQVKAVLRQIPLLAGARLRQLARSDPARARRIARQRGCIDATRLAHAVSADLAQVCAVALRKQPHERYASVDALREDLRRALAGLPIHARGNDGVYRARRWLRRHVLAVALATTAAASLLGAVAALWSQTQSLERERDRAREQTRVAQQQRQRAEFLGGFLLDAFRRADPTHTMGAALTAKQILGAGATQLENAQDADPASRIEIAITLADIEYGLGLFAEADRLIDFGREHLAAMTAPPRRLVAYQHYVEAIRARHSDRWADTKREAQAGVDALGDRPSDVPGERLWVALLRLRADTHFFEDDYAGMWPLYRELVDAIPTLHWMTPVEAWDLRIRLAWALEQTEQTRAESGAILTQVLQEQAAANAQGTAMNAFALALLASFELHTDNPHAARQHAEQSLDIYRNIFGDRHQTVARAFNWAADAEAEDGDPKLAIEHYQQAMRIYEAHGMQYDNDGYFGVLHNIGVVYDDVLGDLAHAEQFQRAALAAFEKTMGHQNSATMGAELSLANVLVEEGRYAEADALLQEARRTVDDVMPRIRWPEFRNAVQTTLALVRHAQGRDDEARELLRVSLPGLHWYPMQNRALMRRAQTLAQTLHVSFGPGESAPTDLTTAADLAKSIPVLDSATHR